MPRLHEITYSRDATIAAIRDYYHFLTKMYLPTSAVIEPPPDGWPTITADSLRPLGKTDEVIALLRHLPYICEPSDDTDRMQGAPYCYFADYRSGRFDPALREGRGGDVRILTEGPDYDQVPAHVVGLTKAGQDNPIFLLDTRLGIVYWANGCPDGPGKQPSREQVVDAPEDYAPESEVEWRSDAPAWSVADFFELLKDEFRALHFVPLNSKSAFDTYTEFSEEEEGLIPMLQGIYRDCGWPDLNAYKKEECLEAVQKALEEHYPDYVDYV